MNEEAQAEFIVMPVGSKPKETLDDLSQEPGKAELIGGRIIRHQATGYKLSRVAARIFRSLDDFAEATGKGVGLTDNMGFGVPELPSGRESFCPDASYYVGPLPANLMRFIDGAPPLAVEVRSETDYRPGAEAEMAHKWADYFAAGTAVVWDVDTEAERIHVYRAKDPTQPASYGRGDSAEAEPAVPGWQVPVDWIFQ